MLLILSGAALLLLASACDTGEAGAPDPRLSAVADRLAAATVELTFPWDTSAPEDGSLQAEEATPAAGGTASIGNTGGTGVSLRSGCTDDARVPGAWADTVVVTVIEFGTDACAGWTFAAGEGIESWVRDEYLLGLVPPEDGAVAVDPRTARLQGWTTRLVDGSGRVTLLARHLPGTEEAAPTVTFLRRLAGEMSALALELSAAPPFEAPACDLALAQLATAAGDLEALSRNVASFFETPSADTEAIEQSADAYIESQGAAVSAVSACAPSSA